MESRRQLGYGIFFEMLLGSRPPLVLEAPLIWAPNLGCRHPVGRHHFSPPLKARVGHPNGRILFANEDRPPPPPRYGVGLTEYLIAGRIPHSWHHFGPSHREGISEGIWLFADPQQPTRRTVNIEERWVAHDCPRHLEESGHTSAL